MTPDALIIGGGPSGLMAAEALLSAGCSVLLAEAKPSLGRKLLMAGKSGLNLTKAEPFETFLGAYGAAAPHLRPALEAFGPDQVRDWTEALGQDTFVGSSGRLFPQAMKASPLLRAWLGRLEGQGLSVRTRWRWQGWNGDHVVLFDTPDGQQEVRPRVTVMAFGGASWARLGSDGAWARVFREAGLSLAPFAPSNAGIRIDWSDHMARHLGAPLKNVVLRAGETSNRGEVVLSARGMEGGGLYPLTPALRDGHGLSLDLFPDRSTDALRDRLATQTQGKQSQTSFLRKALRLSPAALALAMECARPLPRDPAALAELLKALPVKHQGLRPLDEAISTAGGVPFAAMDTGFMLSARPGTFCAGEMLDWEAPTGGYLLTACLATGLHAGRQAAAWLGGAG